MYELFNIKYLENAKKIQVHYCLECGSEDNQLKLALKNTSCRIINREG